MDHDAELQIVQKYYRQAVASARTDAEELDIARELLDGAQRGKVPNDSGSALYTIHNPKLPVNARWLLGDESLRQRLRRILPAVAVAVAGLIIVLLAYGGGGKETTPNPAATSDIALTLPTQTLTPLPATPSPTETSLPRPTATTSPPTVTATPARPREIDIKPEAVKLEPNAVIPVSLEIAGRYFPVVPTTLRDDTWAYVTEPGRASWLAGSAVNVVLGLPYDEDNQDLLAARLQISDTLTLRNSVGGTLVYRVLERRQVSVYETEALSQHRVGLTLVLLGGNEENPDRRLLIQARPVDQGEVIDSQD